jgi:hypothetical protein
MKITPLVNNSFYYLQGLGGAGLGASLLLSITVHYPATLFTFGETGLGETFFSEVSFPSTYALSPSGPGHCSCKFLLSIFIALRLIYPSTAS